MTSIDGSRSIVLRVWRHGDSMVARILHAQNGVTDLPISLAGADSILEWIGEWIDGDPSSHDVDAIADGPVTSS